MGFSAAINSHEKAFSVITEFVWFEGDGALKEGQGVCYNWDYGTAADTDGRRGNRVELPAILNAPYFAGVADKVYAAQTGGQFITINKPGSYCNVWSSFNNVIGVGVSTFEVGTGGSGAGFFGRAGFPGKGSFTPLQTIDRSTPGLCFGYLQDGEQSGGIEVITPLAGSPVAIVLMVGGVTYLIGTVTIATQDHTFTLADGTYPRQRKGFICEGTYSSFEVEVTVTSGELTSGGTNLATVSFNADLEEMTLTWHGFDTNTKWVVDHYVGAALTA
ncbi:hypothetical protein LCGC14_1410020 [marine sediment metagenome]|uniref:Uncharacterized protein n=1 Tax=marine sediment metagenome TaxID=412755 RepID=A0A0F9JUL6_9ZZZZ